jgi:lysophospholipase L1-like esterase
MQTTTGTRAFAAIGVFFLFGFAPHKEILAQDVTGDGKIHILAFGDSITYGVGDGENSGDFVEVIDDAGSPRGYPLRLSSDSSWIVSNAGLPGEQLLRGGAERFPDLVVGTDVDTVVFMEGVNDAVQRVEASEYRAAVQRVINVTRAEGKNMVLNTLPPPTVMRESLTPYTNLYSTVVRELAAVNDLAVADVEQKFVTDCPDMASCRYYNLPEGLHPNTSGYDAIAEVVRSTLNK